MSHETITPTTVQPEPAVASLSKSIRVVSQSKSTTTHLRGTHSHRRQTPMVYGFQLDTEPLEKLGEKLYPLPPGAVDDSFQVQDRRTCLAIRHIMASTQAVTHWSRVRFAAVVVTPEMNGNDAEVLVVGMRQGGRSSILSEELLIPLTEKMAELGFGPPAWFEFQCMI